MLNAILGATCHIVNPILCKTRRPRAKILVPLRAARILDSHTLVLFDPAVVVTVTSPRSLPDWAVLSNGQPNLRALAHRCLRAGAALLDRESLEVLRGLEVYTLAEWLEEGGSLYATRR